MGTNYLAHRGGRGDEGPGSKIPDDRWKDVYWLWEKAGKRRDTRLLRKNQHTESGMHVLFLSGSTGGTEPANREN